MLVRLSSEQRQQLPHKPLELIFTNVTVYVEKRRVLHDVSGLVKPGQLLAVMGPSGKLRCRPQLHSAPHSVLARITFASS